jgi:hypothetical protein
MFFEDVEELETYGNPFSAISFKFASANPDKRGANPCLRQKHNPSNHRKTRD